MIGAGHLLEEDLRIGDFEVEGAKGTHAHDPEVLVAHHDGVTGAPFVTGEEAGGDVIDIRLEGALEAIFPAFQRGEDGDVVGDEVMLAGAESVPELAEIHELGHLGLANDELGTAFDFLVLVREAPGEGVA